MNFHDCDTEFTSWLWTVAWLTWERSEVKVVQLVQGQTSRSRGGKTIVGLNPQLAGWRDCYFPRGPSGGKERLGHWVQAYVYTY